MSVFMLSNVILLVLEQQKEKKNIFFEKEIEK